MEFKGTKGKWIFDMDEYHQQAIIYSDTSGNGVICEVDYTKSNMSQVHYDFNLMAHSKDMLELLQRFVDNNMLSIQGELEAKSLIKSATEVDNEK